MNEKIYTKQFEKNISNHFIWYLTDKNRNVNNIATVGEVFCVTLLDSL